MAEPIPSASNADTAAEDDLPKNAEDRKAAKALDALNANAMSQENGETVHKQPSAADQEALGKAMSRLEIASGTSKKESPSKKAESKKEAEVKPRVKISNEDVNFLMNELDIAKTKATELLRQYNGQADQAIRSFLIPAVKA